MESSAIYKKKSMFVSKRCRRLARKKVGYLLLVRGRFVVGVGLNNLQAETQWEFPEARELFLKTQSISSLSSS